MRSSLVLLLNICLCCLYGQSLTSISPNASYIGESLSVSLTGNSTSFTQSTNTINKVWLNNGGLIINLENVSVVNVLQLNADLTIPNNVSYAGSYNVLHASIDTVLNSSSDTLLLNSGFTVNNLPAIVANWSGDSVGCDNVSIEISSHANHSSYSWSDGSSNRVRTFSSSGAYSVTVTDIYSQTVVKNVNIVVYSGPVLNLVTDTVSTKNSITIDAGAGYSAYSWNTGESTQTKTIFNDGTYTVDVVDANGCTANASTTVSFERITAVSPSQAYAGETLVVSLTGTANAFTQSTNTINKVWLNNGGIEITSDTMEVLSDTELNGTFSIPSDADTGLWDVFYAKSASDTMMYSNSFMINDTSISLPTVTTSSVTLISVDSAVCGGTIDTNGGAAITASGVVWNTISNATLGNNLGITAENVTDGVFSSNITGLDANTTYYVRAYATNSAGTAYGLEDTFITLSPALEANWLGDSVGCDAVTIEIVNHANHSSYNWSDGSSDRFRTFTSSGNYSVTVTDIYSQTVVKSVNIVVSTSPVLSMLSDTVSTKDSIILDPGAGYASYSWNTGETTQTKTIQSDGTYSVTVTDANSCTANASTNVSFERITAIDLDTAYLGETVVVSLTGTANAFTQSTNTINKVWLNNGGIEITSDTMEVLSDTELNGTFSIPSDADTGLWDVFYAKSASDTMKYNNSFSILDTTPVSLPTINTTSVTYITDSSAVSGGTIDTNGGAAITASGVVWDTVSNPTIESNLGITNEDSASGSFVSNITGLSSGTTYYVRAYATNSAGTAYGVEDTFVTDFPISCTSHLSIIKVDEGSNGYSNANYTDSSTIESGDTISSAHLIIIKDGSVIKDTSYYNDGFNIKPENGDYSATHYNSLTGMNDYPFEPGRYDLSFQYIIQTSQGCTDTIHYDFNGDWNDTACQASLALGSSVNFDFDSQLYTVSMDDIGTNASSGDNILSFNGMLFDTYKEGMLMKSEYGYSMHSIDSLQVGSYTTKMYITTLNGCTDSAEIAYSMMNPTCDIVDIPVYTNLPVNGLHSLNVEAPMTSPFQRLNIYDVNGNVAVEVLDDQKRMNASTYQLELKTIDHQFVIADSMDYNLSIDSITDGDYLLYTYLQTAAGCRDTFISDTISLYVDANCFSPLNIYNVTVESNNSTFMIDNTHSIGVGDALNTSSITVQTVDSVLYSGAGGSNGIGLSSFANGTYEIFSTILTNQGCTDSSRLFIEFVDSAICSGSGVSEIIGDTSMNTEGDTHYTYTNVMDNLSANIQLTGDTSVCGGFENDQIILVPTGGVSYMKGAAIFTDTLVYNITASEVIVIEGTDANGCQGVDSINVQINEVLSSNSFGVMTVNSAGSIDSISICEGASFEFSAWGGFGGVSYDFYISRNGNESLVYSAQGFTDGGAYGEFAKYNASDLQDGDSVFVVSTDSNACVIGPSAKVGVNVTPAPVLTINIPEMCEGSLVDITADGADSIMFLVNNNVVQSGTNSIYNYTAVSGDQLSVKGFNGECSTTFEDSLISIDTMPVISIENDALNNTICKDSLINFQASGADSFIYAIKNYNEELIVLSNASGIYATDSLSREDTLILYGLSGVCITDAIKSPIKIEECITACPLMLAEFNYELNNGILTVQDSSFGNDITNYQWNIGDLVYLEGDSVVYTFEASGYYDICLTIFDSLTQCSDQICKNIEVIIDTNDVTCNADFSYTNRRDSVFFVNESEGIFTNVQWIFGNGTYSNKLNLNRKLNFGIQQVCLKVLDSVSSCQSTSCITLDIANEDTQVVSCFADFDYYLDLNNKEIFFTNKSLGDVSRYYWELGDGAISFDDNPEHTYANYDAYDVKLVTLDDSTGCQSEMIKTIRVVDTNTIVCKASFEYFIDMETRKVVFENTSIGDFENIHWNFGDGNYSADTNEVHIYEEDGYYEVTLSVYNINAACQSIISETIEIIDSSRQEESCQALFSVYPDIENKAIVMSNKSIGNNLNYYWEISNGEISFDEHPSISVLENAYLDVCLTIVNTENNCQSKYCLSIEFIDSSLNNDSVICKADFNFYPDVENEQVIFENTSKGSFSNVYWDFGDGSSSSSNDSIHIYEKSDIYTVVLNIYDIESQCHSSIEKTIELLDSGAVACVADFSYLPNSDSLTVMFQNSSIGDLDRYYWSFGNGKFSDDEAPIVEFKKYGYYDVCLTVFDNFTSCQSQVCHTIELIDPTTIECFADFDFFPTSDSAHIKFMENAKGEFDNYYWDFGDGNYADNRNPVHKYEYDGYYQVTFTIFNDSTLCQASVGKEVEVKAEEDQVSCKANFGFYPGDTTFVSFTNESTGSVNKYYWVFGDGSISSEFSPNHIYAKGGNYTVTLHVYDTINDCHHMYQNEIEVIDSEDVYCMADFSYYPDSNGQVIFTSRSQGELTSVQWNFGDGTIVFDSAVIAHEYEVYGYYEVSLTVIDDNNKCMDSYSAEVVAGREEAKENNCQARFDYDPNEKQLKLTNKSIGDYAEVLWIFGDGTNSENPNIVNHQYEEFGYYDVTLVVVDTNTNCFDTKTETIILLSDEGTEEEVYCKAEFDYIVQNDRNNTVKFTDRSYGNVTKRYWDFGDGGQASKGKNPANSFKQDGYYEVCLTVVTDAGCQETYCDVIAVGDVSGTCYANFDYFLKSELGFAKFNNKSLGDSLSFTWDFGDEVTSEQKHPGHSYADSGYYAVCLTASTNSGFVSTKCKDVNIGNSIANKCLFDCVWPGDANNDLEANHYDILGIGMNYGKQGPKRDSISSLWIGHQSVPWSTYQSDGVNNMHADCNGDGIVNFRDTISVTENFGYSHYRQYRKNAQGNPISIVVNGDVIPGEAVSIDVIVGDDITPLTMYGIGFEVGFDSDQVDIETATVSWNDSWLDDEGEEPDLVTVTWNDDWIGDETEEEDLWADSWLDEEDEEELLLKYDAIDAQNTLLLASATKKDGRNVTDAGVISSLTVMVNENIEGDSLSINIYTEGAIQNDGTVLDFTDDELVVSIDKSTKVSGYRDLIMYPNPANSNVNLYVNNSNNYNLEVYDLSGRVVQQQQNVSGGLIQLDVSGFEVGLYYIKIYSDELIYQDKFEIIR